MGSKSLPDNPIDVPPVPIKTYQWEDLKRARKAGGYPWTHLQKPELEGEITAEDILRETSPRRSMSRSREVSKERSRTRSPIERDVQKILELDSSPGSSRKHGEEGEENGINIPKFSKEISLDSEEEQKNTGISSLVKPQEEAKSRSNLHLAMPMEVPKNVSPKSILKRRNPEQAITITESRQNTKCCHPLVNKIKHIADKTLHKLERNEDKSPGLKRKKTEEKQQVIQLKSSPGARRHKFGAIKLGDSDEMSKSIEIDIANSPIKRKEHIYEDIEQVDSKEEPEKTLQFSPDILEAPERSIENEGENDLLKRETESLSEKKSLASQDPSLTVEEANENLRPEDHIMETLHNVPVVEKEALLLDSEESDIEEVIKQQLEESGSTNNESPNITITEITDEDGLDYSKDSSPEKEPPFIKGKTLSDTKIEESEAKDEWSKQNSDHEYEIIGKPPPNIIFNVQQTEDKNLGKADDELSSTTSLDRKYLQNASDEEDQQVEKEVFHQEKDEDIEAAEALQKDIEDRYFVSTPSTVSRTECDVSTSQVDSSALENLPLKRENRTKNMENVDSKLQQRFREQTGKLRTQAGKLKSKLQSMKERKFSMPERPKFQMPERPKFKMPERPKINFPDRPKFSLPDRRKFSLPDRPKFKKINFSEKLSLGDRKKFTFPDRPKFNMPKMPEFKMPDKPKISFPSLGRKKEYKIDESSESINSQDKVVTVDFESRTYPRPLNRKKSQKDPLTSSSPTLNRAGTPPPTFSFAKMGRGNESLSTYRPESPKEPREYGNITSDDDGHIEHNNFETSYDFDEHEYEEQDNRGHESNLQNNDNLSLPDVSLSKPQCSHVINEIDNDEFFVRPKGISRENIQVRQYLSDEIRQAFKIPTNSLAMMGGQIGSAEEPMYANEPDADPELYMEDDFDKPETEDINEMDDGYYTFPPVRPSRAKRLKKEMEKVEYIDQSAHASMQFSDVDLEARDDEYTHEQIDDNVVPQTEEEEIPENYDDEEMIEEINHIQSQTLPLPPKRKKKTFKPTSQAASLRDFHSRSTSDMKLWNGHQDDADIIVYRTEHEYVVPESPTTGITDGSPVPPRRSRNRSRSSFGTSFADDDRTSHGAESLILDIQLPATEPEFLREIRHESPGYATVDKYPPSKAIRRSKSKTPPVRRRKSHSSERKYYTVGNVKKSLPDRPPRKKSSTSLLTLDSQHKLPSIDDVTQYVEIDNLEDTHKDLKSGDVISKMKDRPLPPPPRPPRGPKKKKSLGSQDEDKCQDLDQIDATYEQQLSGDSTLCQDGHGCEQDIVETEMATQTDPLPDDLDYELGMDETIDISMSSSLRDIIDDDPFRRSQGKLSETPRGSRPASRSEKSLKLAPSDPKIAELSKANIGRTSPTVILVERRVSSPTRINEREEIVTEASLTVQHIDVDESLIPDVPPLPRSRATPTSASRPTSRSAASVPEEKQTETALEKVSKISDVQLDNLVTQRLQVQDLDVGRLNVSELQASKILVSEIEGMTLQVTELDSKSGHISVSGIDLSPSIVDEIVKKFAELATSNMPPSSHTNIIEIPRPKSREEQTQTEQTEPDITEVLSSERQTQAPTTSYRPKPPVPELPTEDLNPSTSFTVDATTAPTPPPVVDTPTPPQRPPPPDLSPLLYSYLQDITLPPNTLYQLRTPRERPFTDFFESQHQPPPPPTRRAKRKPNIHSESSSDEGRRKPSPRRMPPPVRVHEPTITEAGAQFIRVCHNSVSRTFRSIFNSLMSYISGSEDKKDVQMAMVIVLVLIAGLIMFGLSDGRTVHHHHWEFFNPPDGGNK